MTSAVTSQMTSQMSLAMALAPLAITGSAACLVLLLGVLLGERFHSAVSWLAVLALAAVVLLVALALPQAGHTQPMLSDMWVADRLALVFDLIIATVAGMTLVIFRPSRASTPFLWKNFRRLCCSPPPG
jgi:NADH:ubiquinone oxidoreductase subunit 2 (subunit N)